LATLTQVWSEGKSLGEDTLAGMLKKAAPLGLVVALGFLGLLSVGCGASPGLEGKWTKEDFGAASTFTFDGKRAVWSVEAMGVPFTISGDAEWDPRRGVLKVTDISPEGLPLPLSTGDIDKAMKSRDLPGFPESATFNVSFKNPNRLILRATRPGMIPAGAFDRFMEAGQ
jgi:hypothetical protein